MSMLDVLKQRLLEARKASQPVEMGVLQVVLGDASMIEARTGKKATDDEIEKLIRKTLLGNQETLGLLEKSGQQGGDNHAKLTRENVLLQSLLPQTLPVADIVAELSGLAEGLCGAKSEGQATGMAMKHLKGKNLRVLGEDVAVAVKQLRGG